MTDFSKIFGAQSNTSGVRSSKNAQAEERPKTQLWLNIGYETGDEKYPFLSLPTGIPLDNMEPVAVRGSDKDYRDFCIARNDFLAQMLKLASTLQPGEDVIIPGTNGLSFQIRRVNDEQANDTSVSEDNKFAKKFMFQD